ncbi:hypothetical protein QAD02_016102 [Eretmocerus hayati]|uniref:Uncharacterized protein n=1 Tax=Eretmocerus hayati TaxID=131215 RepID=A0ACC2PA90_9HYME|nr:hypothetical protein QAD02_016102 [Eretmocerus hayati]
MKSTFSIDYEILWQETVNRLREMERQNQELRDLIQNIEQTCSHQAPEGECSSTSTSDDNHLSVMDPFQETKEDPRWTILQKLAHEFFQLKIELTRLAKAQTSNSNPHERFSAELCQPGPSRRRTSTLTELLETDTHDINQLLAEMESLKKTFTGFYFNTIINCQMQDNMFLKVKSSESNNYGSTSTDGCDDESITNVLELNVKFKKMIQRARGLIRKFARSGRHSMR